MLAPSVCALHESMAAIRICTLAAAPHAAWSALHQTSVRSVADGIGAGVPRHSTSMVPGLLGPIKPMLSRLCLPVS